MARRSVSETAAQARLSQDMAERSRREAQTRDDIHFLRDLAQQLDLHGGLRSGVARLARILADRLEREA